MKIFTEIINELLSLEIMEERQVKLLNVGLLGLAFMLVFTAFQTLGNVQPIILDSARNESSGGYVEGLYKKSK